MPNPKSWRNWDEKIASNWPESCGFGRCGAADLCGGRLLPEAISDPNTDQPEDYQGQRREHWNEKKRRAVHPHRHHLLLPEEERTGGEEQRKAHPPEVARQVLDCGQSLAQDYMQIEQTGEQAYAGKREHRAAAHRRRRRDGRQAEPREQHGGAERGRAGNDLEFASRATTPAGGDPRRRDEVADHNPADR